LTARYNMAIGLLYAEISAGPAWPCHARQAPVRWNPAQLSTANAGWQN